MPLIEARDPDTILTQYQIFFNDRCQPENLTPSSLKPWNNLPKKTKKKKNITLKKDNGDTVVILDKCSCKCH